MLTRLVRPEPRHATAAGNTPETTAKTPRNRCHIGDRMRVTSASRALAAARRLRTTLLTTPRRSGERSDCVRHHQRRVRRGLLRPVRGLHARVRPDPRARRAGRGRRDAAASRRARPTRRWRRDAPCSRPPAPTTGPRWCSRSALVIFLFFALVFPGEAVDARVPSGSSSSRWRRCSSSARRSPAPTWRRCTRTAGRPGDRVFGPIERLIYRVCGIDPEGEQRWKTYAISLLSFNAVAVLAVYFVQRIQAHLPFNPTHVTAVPPFMALNTSVSFVTNTDWQSYVPEVDGLAPHADGGARRARTSSRPRSASRSRSR